MNRTIIILGNTPQLSIAEISAVLKRLKIDHTIESTEESFLTILTAKPISAAAFMYELGGTVKIASWLNEVPHPSAPVIATSIPMSVDFTEFGISIYGKINVSIPSLCGELKEIFQVRLGHSIRYILPQENGILSKAALKKPKVVEFVLLCDTKSKKWVVGKTETIQDIDAWRARDVGRPHIDSKSGMLPLKVARMMVNLGLTKKTQTTVIADPFCGMGSIISEALMLGLNIIGSDYDAQVVTYAEENMAWLKRQSSVPIDRRVRIFKSDATHLGEHIAPLALDAIVTEPYLGAPYEYSDGVLIHKSKPVSKMTIVNSLRGLEKLYRGVLKEWYTLLKSDARVVIAFPEIHWQARAYTVKKLIDNCENLGYTLTEGPYLYARSQAIVRRLITVFTKR